MLQPIVVHHQHDKIYTLHTDLEARTSAADGNESWCAPPGVCAASAHAAAVLASDDETAFHQVRNDQDAFRAIQHLFGNSLVGSGHDLVEDVGSILESLRRIFPCRAGPSHAAK